MQAKAEFRDRPPVQVKVLDALVDREDGMTVFELRSHVDADIDGLETALGELKDDSLITADTSEDPTVIRVADHVRPDPGDAEPAEPQGTESFVDWVRRKIGL